MSILLIVSNKQQPERPNKSVMTALQQIRFDSSMLAAIESIQRRKSIYVLCNCHDQCQRTTIFCIFLLVQYVSLCKSFTLKPLYQEIAF